MFTGRLLCARNLSGSTTVDKMKTVFISRENTGRALCPGSACGGVGDVTARFAGPAGVNQVGREAGSSRSREAALVMGVGWGRGQAGGLSVGVECLGLHSGAEW